MRWGSAARTRCAACWHRPPETVRRNGNWRLAWSGTFRYFALPLYLFTADRSAFRTHCARLLVAFQPASAARSVETHQVVLARRSPWDIIASRHPVLLRVWAPELDATLGGSELWPRASHRVESVSAVTHEDCCQPVVGNHRSHLATMSSWPKWSVPHDRNVGCSVPWTPWLQFSYRPIFLLSRELMILNL